LIRRRHNYSTLKATVEQSVKRALTDPSSNATASVSLVSGPQSGGYISYSLVTPRMWHQGHLLLVKEPCVLWKLWLVADWGPCLNRPDLALNVEVRILFLKPMARKAGRIFWDVGGPWRLYMMGSLLLYRK
jgi:hypothetical protein